MTMEKAVHIPTQAGAARSQDASAGEDPSDSDKRKATEAPADAGTRGAAFAATVAATAQESSPSRTAKTAEAAPAAKTAAVDEPAAAAPKAPLQDLTISLNNTPGKRVDLVFAQSGDDVKVTVRAQDPGVASALNAELPRLEQSLQSKGYVAEMWSGTTTHSTANSAGSDAGSSGDPAQPGFAESLSFQPSRQLVGQRGQPSRPGPAPGHALVRRSGRPDERIGAAAPAAKGSLRMSTVSGTSSSTTLGDINDLINQSSTRKRRRRPARTRSPPRMFFLQLLVAQLKNQDPLSPSDGTEFVAQLGTVHRARAVPRLAPESRLDPLGTQQHANDGHDRREHPERRRRKHRQTDHGRTGVIHVHLFLDCTKRPERTHDGDRRGRQQPGQPEHARLQGQRRRIQRSGDAVAGRRPGRDAGRIRRGPAGHHPPVLSGFHPVELRAARCRHPG